MADLGCHDVALRDWIAQAWRSQPARKLATTCPCCHTLGAVSRVRTDAQTDAGPIDAYRCDQCGQEWLDAVPVPVKRVPIVYRD